MERIILASGSPRRRELLELAGVNFDVIVSDAEEVITKSIPGEVVEELSLCKAMAVAAKEETRGRIVLGADTIVVQDGEILGKPADEEDAKRMIRKLQGNTHEVYTGVTLIRDGKVRSFHESSEVRVCPMTEEEIMAYVATKEPMDKAGSYAIQGKFAVYIQGITGDYYNIMGLPVSRVWHELQKGI